MFVYELSGCEFKSSYSQEKVCSQPGIPYGDFKDLTKITTSDKILRDKAFNIAKNPQYDRYQRGIS